jgi:uncharacterized RmlC-like cupin family protein
MGDQQDQSVPIVVSGDALAAPPSEQSAGMQRGEAFAHDGVWAGFSHFPGGACTGWHHHGDYATYAYITEGGMDVEYGPGGDNSITVHEGDFVYIPARFVHRETVSAEGGAGVVVRVGGSGQTTYNIDSPDEEPSTP